VCIETTSGFPSLEKIDARSKLQPTASQLLLQTSEQTSHAHQRGMRTVDQCTPIGTDHVVDSSIFLLRVDTVEEVVEELFGQVSQTLKPHPERTLCSVFNETRATSGSPCTFSPIHGFRYVDKEANLEISNRELLSIHGKQDFRRSGETSAPFGFQCVGNTCIDACWHK